MQAAVDGFVAALSVHKCVDASFASSVVRQRSGQCLLLNGALFLGSIAVFDWVVGPAARSAAERADWAMLRLGRGGEAAAAGERVAAETVDAVSSAVFQLAWLVPIYGVSVVLSSAWYSQLADAALQLSTRASRPKRARSVDPESSVADEIYRTLFLVVVLLEATLCAAIPYCGQLLSFCVLCWCVLRLVVLLRARERSLPLIASLRRPFPLARI